MLSQKTKCAIAGLLAGAANGFFGAGGGMILVPLLSRWAKVDQRKAFATSIFIILPLCIISAAVYLMTSTIDLTLAAPYLVGGFAGGLVGGKLFRKIPIGLLHKILGLLILYGGIRILL